MGTAAAIVAAVTACALIGVAVATAYHLCFGIAEDDGE